MPVQIMFYLLLLVKSSSFACKPCHVKTKKPYHLRQWWSVHGLLSPLSADEGPPCTCPLCASDWSSCVPHSEGLQLSRDLGATYLELPSLNHVFVGRYFGSVVSDCISCITNTRIPGGNLNHFLSRLAGVLHDSVSEAQSQRAAGEETGE